MVDITTLINKLIQEIRKDVVLAKELVKILQHERIVLEQKNIEQIETVTEKKARIILALNDNQLVRDSIQEQLGSSIGFKGLQCILKKFNLQKHPGFKETFQELEKLLLQIKNLTEINGTIISISQAQTARIIDILYGRENTSYGENAQIYSTSTSKFLTKA